MALHRAVGCDTDGCLALYVAVPQSGPDAALYAAQRAGWDIKPSVLSTRCPACRNGGPVVSERGDCPVCMGATYDGRSGEVCHFCGHLMPHQADEGDELAVVDEDQVQHDHGQEDGEQLATAAAPEGGARR